MHSCKAAALQTTHDCQLVCTACGTVVASQEEFEATEEGRSSSIVTEQRDMQAKRLLESICSSLSLAGCFEPAFAAYRQFSRLAGRCSRLEIYACAYLSIRTRGSMQSIGLRSFAQASQQPLFELGAAFKRVERLLQRQAQAKHPQTADSVFAWASFLANLSPPNVEAQRCSLPLATALHRRICLPMGMAAGVQPNTLLAALLLLTLPEQRLLPTAAAKEMAGVVPGICSAATILARARTLKTQLCAFAATTPIGVVAPREICFFLARLLQYAPASS